MRISVNHIVCQTAGIHYLLYIFFICRVFLFEHSMLKQGLAYDLSYSHLRIKRGVGVLEDNLHLFS